MSRGSGQSQLAGAEHNRVSHDTISRSNVESDISRSRLARSVERQNIIKPTISSSSGSAPTDHSKTSDEDFITGSAKSARIDYKMPPYATANSRPPSLVSNEDTISEQSFEVKSASDAGDYLSLGSSHAAFPSNLQTRQDAQRLNGINLALNDLVAIGSQSESGSSGIDRFLDARDDPWTSFSLAPACRSTQLSLFLEGIAQTLERS